MPLATPRSWVRFPEKFTKYQFTKIYNSMVEILVKLICLFVLSIIGLFVPSVIGSFINAMYLLFYLFIFHVLCFHSCISTVCLLGRMSFLFVISLIDVNLFINSFSQSVICLFNYLFVHLVSCSKLIQFSYFLFPKQNFK